MNATCTLTNFSDYDIKGNILFKIIRKNNKDIMKISINISGLKPGLHGFHIHNTGNLTHGTKSLCSHFNPDNTNHGDIINSKKNRHAGDLGNIKVNKNGICKQILYDDIIKLSGKYNIIGRSVIIHENPDDLGKGGLDKDGNIINKKIYKESLKNGNSGDRIAAGVIGWA